MFVDNLVTTFSGYDTGVCPVDQPPMFSVGTDNNPPSSLANPNNVPVPINFLSAVTL